MKKFLVFVLALAGVLGFAPSNSFAQSSDPYGEMIELELDGWAGDGGTYGAFIGIRGAHGPYTFPCGFTVKYDISGDLPWIRLTGEAHYQSSATYYTRFNETDWAYYYPYDGNRPFLPLNENPPGSRPTGMYYMYVTIIPDDSRYKEHFERIIIRHEPFAEHMNASGNVMGTAPVGKPVGEWTCILRIE